jgi:hypothetical protein
MAPIPWKDPWYSIEGQAEIQGMLEAELAKELPPGHVLSGRPVRAIGQRCDNDDVLYVLEDERSGYAVVHLTWCRGREEAPPWPVTTLFENRSDLVANCIEPEALEYAADDDV